MKLRPTIPNQADLLAAFASVPEITEGDIQRLGTSNRALDEDPLFLADIQKAKVVVALRRELDKRGESLSGLAQRWGKTRQYVSRIFNVAERTNFTIETLTHAAFLLGLRVSVQVHRPDQGVILRSKSAGKKVYRLNVSCNADRTTNAIKHIPNVALAYSDPLAA